MKRFPMKHYAVGTWVKMRGLYVATGKVSKYMDGGATVEVIGPDGTVHWMHSNGILLATKSDIQRCIAKFQKPPEVKTLAENVYQFGPLVIDVNPCNAENGANEAKQP
jgi:hypothetical protein